MAALLLAHASQAAPSVRAPRFELSSESCSARMKQLTEAHQLRDFNDILAERLDLARKEKAPRYDEPDCEAVLFAHGGELHVYDPSGMVHVSFVHAFRIAQLQEIVRALPADEVQFVAGIFTSDNGGCAIPRVLGGQADVEVGHVLDALSGPTRSSAPLMVPMHTNQALDYLEDLMAKPRQQKQKFDRCTWHGSPTGYGDVQAKYDANRTSCEDTESDRECVVRLAAEWGMGGIDFETSDDIFQEPCLLAIDGNSYSGLFKEGLMQENLMVRVGGYAASAAGAEKHSSTYEWYEPLLSEGIHYLRTDIDHLHERLQSLPGRTEQHRFALEKIAHQGSEAARELFQRESILCGALLAIQEYASRQPRALEAAAAQGSVWTALSDDVRDRWLTPGMWAVDSKGEFHLSDEYVAKQKLQHHDNFTKTNQPDVSSKANSTTHSRSRSLGRQNLMGLSPRGMSDY